MEQAEKRKYLIKTLLAEQPRYKDMEIPEETGEQKRLLRSLFNVRVPRKISEDFLKVQDEYLQEATKEKGITDLNDLQPIQDGIYLWQGDITTLRCDAIVNAANSGMTGCYQPCHNCIDNCIHTFAGVQLRAECNRQMNELRIRYGRDYEQPTAVPMLTEAYNLPAKKVIHIVGPIVSQGTSFASQYKLTPELEKDLENCYRNTLDMCAENGLKSVAFCCISTGVFHFPNKKAAEIAVKTVSEWLRDNPGKVERVIFNVFKDEDKAIYENLYDDMPNGYQETINKGMSAVRYFSRNMSYGKGSKEEQINRLKKEINEADAIVIGAGAGLSTSAGLTYSGKRFEKYFYDFAKRFGIRDMYSGGFYPFPSEEIRWAWWARHIYFNRYIDAPKPVYRNLLKMVSDKDYFVITTNVDHQFQRAGFDKKRLFYTQGDYGLFQSVNPAIQKTFDNEEWVMKAMEAQGFVRDDQGLFQVPVDGKLLMEIPSEMIPKCPDDGSDMTMNLRADDSFVEDEGWHRASAAYSDFIRRHENLHVLYLELGVGANTPVIIKYPFWQMTLANEKAVYACLNYGESYCPEEIADRSICIDGDIGEVFETQIL